VRASQPATLPDLRALQQQLEAVADTTQDERRSRRIALVAAHLDPLVDAVNTVAHMLDPAAVLEETSA
jgi:hypothetical protein